MTRSHVKNPFNGAFQFNLHNVNVYVHVNFHNVSFFRSVSDHGKYGIKFKLLTVGVHSCVVLPYKSTHLKASVWL